MHASVGDRIIIQTEPAGGRPREGTVREVLGTAGTEHYRVVWDDGHESILYPGPGTQVLPAEAIPRQKAPEPRPTAAGPHDPVERIMRSPVLTVDEHDSLRTAAVTLSDADVGALIVTSNGEPLGILSERDVVRAVAAGGDPDEVWAGDVMAVETIWASPTDSTFDIALLMRDGNVRHVPLRVHDNCVGMVSVRDVLKVLIGT
ncbi:MAG TPA: CBS domain-containing protein [Actinopolymorphaceae bacterium]|jgi:CBS domain-containing protein